MKYSKEGIAIPEKCPHCKSKETALSTYKTNEKFIECFGCHTVIKEMIK